MPQPLGQTAGLDREYFAAAFVAVCIRCRNERCAVDRTVETVCHVARGNICRDISGLRQLDSLGAECIPAAAFDPQAFDVDVAECNAFIGENRSVSAMIVPFSAMIPFPAKTRSVDDSPAPAEQ